MPVREPIASMLCAMIPMDEFCLLVAGKAFTVQVLEEADTNYMSIISTWNYRGLGAKLLKIQADFSNADEYRLTELVASQETLQAWLSRYLLAVLVCPLYFQHMQVLSSNNLHL